MIHLQSQEGDSKVVMLILIVCAILAAAVGFFTYQYFRQPYAPVSPAVPLIGKPSVDEIYAQSPNLVVKGHGLASVKIYLVPTGTGINPETMSMVVMAEKQPDGGSSQTWIYRYPADLLLTAIFARGYDQTGALVGQADFPMVGATDIVNALYGAASLHPDWKTYADAAHGFSFSYPPSLDTNFASFQRAPAAEVLPQASPAIDAQGCYKDRNASGAMLSRVVVNGIAFCLTEGQDAAAGQLYRSYHYATLKDGNYIVAGYVVHAPNGCGAYMGTNTYRGCQYFMAHYDEIALQPIKESIMTFLFTK